MKCNSCKSTRFDDDVVALAKNSLSRFSQENTGDMRGREGLSPDRNCDGVINSLLASFDVPKQTDAMGLSEEKVLDVWQNEW